MNDARKRSLILNARFSRSQEKALLALLAPDDLSGTAQELSGAGAIAVDSYLTKITTTGANAYTLADGRKGQVKTIVMVADGGNGTLTPANLHDATTIVFSEVGDTAVLRWDGGAWRVVATSNAADDEATPVVA